MQLNVTGHHIEVTAALRGYVEKKLERIARHFDQVIDVHCVLTVEKLRQKAEATLRVSGNAIHADATEEDMYAAIDLLTDKLDRCVKKYKEKRWRSPCCRGQANGQKPVHPLETAAPAGPRSCGSGRFAIYRAARLHGGTSLALTSACAHHHPFRPVRLRQERGSAHARGPGVLLHRQHSGGAAEALYLLHGTQSRADL